MHEIALFSPQRLLIEHDNLVVLGFVVRYRLATGEIVRSTYDQVVRLVVFELVFERVDSVVERWVGRNELHNKQFIHTALP